MENDSPRTIDWLAIRAAYETGGKSVNIIAGLHGVSKGMIDRRREKENWPMRRDTGRIAPRPAAEPKMDHVDWLAVRHDYETGNYSVAEVAIRHGCSKSRVYTQRDLERWQPRRPAYPKAYGAGGMVAARLKAGLAQKLATISAGLGLDEKIDVSDPLKGLHTLANAYDKLLAAAKENSGDDSDRLHINDATRDALAERIEALADSWERKRGFREAECEATGAD
ncbi:MAG TPA: hypothetical protein VF224_01565 [Aestuariivirga sp.]